MNFTLFFVTVLSLSSAANASKLENLGPGISCVAHSVGNPSRSIDVSLTSIVTSRFNGKGRGRLIVDDTSRRPSRKLIDAPAAYLPSPQRLTIESSSLSFSMASTNDDATYELTGYFEHEAIAGSCLRSANIFRQIW